jgi:hypothetical protein
LEEFDLQKIIGRKNINLRPMKIENDITSFLNSWAKRLNPINPGQITFE